MYATHTGHSRDLTAEQIAINNFNSCCEIAQKEIYVGNQYWQHRILVAYNELVRLDLVKERTTYQNMTDAEKDFAASRKSPRSIYNSNRRAMYHWWLKVQAENGRSTSPYHF